MAQGKKSFVLYSDYCEVFKELSDVDAGQLIKHIFSYVNDENPVTENAIVKITFIGIKNQLKRDLREWEESRERRSKAGQKGMESRWNKGKKPPKTPPPKQPPPKQPPAAPDETTIPSFKKINEKQFYDSIVAVKNRIDYPKEMLREFYNYWSEKSDKGKMRFQLQKTWELSKRLVTWNSKQKPKFNGQQKTVTEGRSKLGNKSGGFGILSEAVSEVREG